LRLTIDLPDNHLRRVFGTDKPVLALLSTAITNERQRLEQTLRKFEAGGMRGGLQRGRAAVATLELLGGAVNRVIRRRDREPDDDRGRRHDVARLFMSPERAAEVQRLIDQAPTEVDAADLVDQMVVRSALFAHWRKIPLAERFTFERQADEIVTSAYDVGVFTALARTGLPQSELAELVRRALEDGPSDPLGEIVWSAPAGNGDPSEGQEE
jgi:hypothetical protein